MGFPWKRVLKGLKIAANIAIDLNDAHVIKIKGADKAKTIRDVIEKNVEAERPKPTA